MEGLDFADYVKRAGKPSVITISTMGLAGMPMKLTDVHIYQDRGHNVSRYAAIGTKDCNRYLN